MDAFLGRKKYDSFLGAEGVHLRAWLPSNLRAFIASIEYHYSIPEYVKASGDARLMGVLDGVVEAYTGKSSPSLILRSLIVDRREGLYGRA